MWTSYLYETEKQRPLTKEEKALWDKTHYIHQHMNDALLMLQEEFVEKPDNSKCKSPDRLMGYDEYSVLRRCDTLILKTLHTYQLQDYSDVLQNTAKNIIHSAYEEKRKTDDPKFKAALSADAASELLNQVKAALEEKAQELVSKEADGPELD